MAGESSRSSGLEEGGPIVSVHRLIPWMRYFGVNFQLVLALVQTPFWFPFIFQSFSGGVPGIGKTQLGIQLAINVQIPVKYGGLGGKAIYIDTEGSFMVERVHQIADACVDEIAYGAAVQREHFEPSEERIDANIFLANIFYFRVCSYTEQIAVVNNLDNFIASQDNIRIVIIDSITFHFRQHFEDLALRTRIMSSMVLKLMKIAKKYKLAECTWSFLWYCLLFRLAGLCCPHCTKYR